MGSSAAKISRISGALGLAALAAAALIAILTPRGGETFANAYLVSFVFCLSLALGALFFVLLLGLPVLRVNGFAMLVAVIPFVPRLVGDSPASRWLARGRDGDGDGDGVDPADATAPAPA